MAYAKAMGETVYANTMAEKSCSVTAAKATYAYVKENTGCEQTAAVAYKHAVAKAAFDTSLEKTGCEKTANAAYDEASVAAAVELEKIGKGNS